MKWRISLIAASLMAATVAPAFVLSSGVEIPMDETIKAKPATVNVLVAKQKDRVLLEAKGRYNVYDPYTHMLISSNSRSTRNWIAFDESGLKWGELFPGIYQIRVVPANAESTLLVDGIEYRGCLEIYSVRGKLNVVNQIDIERYLKSTMTAQFPNEMDEEVMEAIAIVSRTNAYHMVSRKLDAPWHVEAQESGYLGHALTLQNIHVDRAINNTRHMVMTYQGAPFASTWTKDSAGKTADYATIFRKDTRTPKGVSAPFAAREREKHQWSFEVEKTELASLLGVAKVSTLDLYQDGESQKVYGARVNDGGQFHQFDFGKLQKALGSVKLKSNDFQVSVVGDRVQFKGFGEGLGVGLCLLSANAMADKGDKAAKILSAFFPDTKLQNIRSFDSNSSRLIADNK
ncbi:MAG: SpoIID/LytB domain-containing protein [Chlamydiota bacterium]